MNRCRTIAIGGLLMGATSLASCNALPIHRPTAEQTFLGLSENWAFRDRFPNADHLFNGFDYGHAIAYETLLHATDSGRALDSRIFAFTRKHVLKHPPSVPLEEAAIGPHYVTLVPEIVLMFSWAHMLHRQIYDVWATPGLTAAERDDRVKRVVAYYESRHDLAFSAKPKSMALMEGQPYSQTFRLQNPKFNGLLWSYHWLQMALYDALMENDTTHAQPAAVNVAVEHFFAMIDSPGVMPTAMPMSGASAPLFTARYPEAAAIFDNLHALHDVVADILCSTTIPHARKRVELLKAAAAYRDDTTAVITRAEWLRMSRSMGRMRR